ncbi:MAG: aminoglycoside phosphotransferase family protein [Thermomicrobiales bacterium]
MHANEIMTDRAMVRRLIAEQFPQWADLPVAPVPSAGTDHALYRLGEDMAVRLPRIPGPEAQADTEFRWLPQLAPHLPVAIPEPLARGEPGAGYPLRWSVYRWLPGRQAVDNPALDLPAIAAQLAGFLPALQAIAPSGWPVPGADASYRGEPLANRDAATRRTIPTLPPEIDGEAVLRGWEAALAVAPWDRAPVWVHGDLQPGNLLAQGGRLSAVIDWGCLGVGDPAVDLMPAWNLLTPETRPIFRAALGVDDATWARGRGWALSVAVIALPYYLHTNPVQAGMSRYVLAQVLGDLEHTPSSS